MLFVCRNTERTIEMSMQSIDFNSGNYKEYAINGDESRVIRINVSDVGIITRIQDAMSKADHIAGEVSEREKSEDRTQLLKEYDQRARDMVNDIFGSDVCTAALGSVNVFSVASNGKPVLVNFLEALLAVVVQEIKSAQRAAQIKLEEKVEKYTAPVITHQHITQPAVNVTELSDEDKKALLRELLK